MRRLLTVLALGAVALVAGLLATGAGEDTSSKGGSYEVDALFSTAGNLIKGQDVKIAGAKVGSVKEVSVTRDYRARVHMEIDEGFAPFRADARCNIQPQSLIGERFVQCEPGSTKAPQLRGRGGEAPTVPLARTSSPVDLDLILSAFRLPTRQRLGIVLNELGEGFVARGGDLNQAIRRANPALRETREVLQVLDRQRGQLQSLIDSSDTILAQLAPRRDRVGETIERAADVADVTAARRDDLSETIRRLPPLLAQARPALADVRQLSEAGTPLLSDLRSASPQLGRLVSDLKPFADAARPTLDRLGESGRTGQRTVRDARPVVRQLRTFAKQAKPTGRMVDQLFASMRERGVVEGLQSFVYNVTLATAWYDRYGHMVPAYPVLPADCMVYATKPVKGCSAALSDQLPEGTAARRERSRSTPTRERRPAANPPQRAPQAPNQPAAPAPTAAPEQAPSAAPEPTATPQVPRGNLGNTLKSLLDTLLR